MSEGGIELVTAYVSIVPEGSTIAPYVRRQFNQVGRDADRAGRDTGRRFSGGFGGALKKGAALVGIGGLGALAAGLVKTSIGVEASFSKTMSQIGASTDGASSHMAELNKLAIKLGAETTFSANDAAGAMLELGKSGINASEIMGGALQGTLLLAAAGSTDLGTAATIASNAMNTFGLKGKDMASIAAALAGGANASSASVESLGQALQQVGPGATNAGLSLQETVGVLSAFDAAGIKGSDAGTSLKTALARLVPQTDAAKNAMAKLGLKFTDAHGSFVPITNVAQQLQDKLGGLSEEQRTTALTTIFGSDATRAATVLMKQGSKGIGTYIKATKDQNAAQKLAKANMSGTAGAIERLKGSVETAELVLGKALAPTVQKVANFLADDAVPAITDFITGMQDGTGAGGDFVDVAKDILSVGKGIVKFFDGLPGPVKKFGVEGAIALLVVRKFGPAFALARTQALAFATGVGTASTRMATMSKAAGSAAGAGGLLLLADGMGKTETAAGKMEVALGAAAAGFLVGGPIGAGIGVGIASFVLLKNSIAGTNDVKMPSPKQLGITDIIKGLDDASAKATEFTKNSLFDFLSGKTKGKPPKGSAIGTTVDATAKLYGIPTREVVQAMSGNTKAFERIKARLAAAVKKGLPFAESDQDTLISSINAVLKGYYKERQAILQQIAVTKDYGHTLDSLPPGKKIKVEATGIIPTVRGIADVANRIKATPKELKTLIKASGAQVAVSDVQRVMDKLAAANKVRANPKIHVDITTTGMATLDKIINLIGSTDLGVKPRAIGGPVTAGQPYIVGEHRPELFVPNQSGRILPRVPATANASGAGTLSGQRMYLVLDDGTTISGYVDQRADDRIGAQRGIDAMTGRAFG